MPFSTHIMLFKLQCHLWNNNILSILGNKLYIDEVTIKCITSFKFGPFPDRK